jgi:hypothetical protein
MKYNPRLSDFSPNAPGELHSSRLSNSLNPFWLTLLNATQKLKPHLWKSIKISAKHKQKNAKRNEVFQAMLGDMNSREDSLTGSRTPISRALPSHDKRKSWPLDHQRWAAVGLLLEGKCLFDYINQLIAKMSHGITAAGRAGLIGWLNARSALVAPPPWTQMKDATTLLLATIISSIFWSKDISKCRCTICATFRVSTLV